eukprot:gene29381-36427_t
MGDGLAPQLLLNGWKTLYEWRKTSGFHMTQSIHCWANCLLSQGKYREEIQCPCGEYRFSKPLIIKLFWMYKDSLTGFNPFTYVENRYRMPNHMGDVVDSPVFKEHMSYMHSQFEAFAETYVAADGVVLKEFSFVAIGCFGFEL